MGHQLNFYLTESDTKNLERVALSGEEALILHDRARGPFPRIAESLDLAEDGRQHGFFFLVRKPDLDSVITKEVPTQGYWTIDDLRSPVIQFMRSVPRNGELRKGRFYFNDSYFDRTGNLVSKSPEFIRWAKMIFSRSKRLLVYEKELGAYLGAEALELRKKGLRLVEL